MKAIVVDPPGKTSDSLRLADVPDPQPSDEEVLLRVHASALNRADMMQRMGNYPAQHGASEILGLELAGEVVEAGSQVQGLTVGDRVYGLSGGGGYAELATLHQSLAMPIPDELVKRVEESEHSAVAFSMFATSMDQLLAVSDAHELMPPKSTWFEPKLRSGLLIHRFAG